MKKSKNLDFKLGQAVKTTADFSVECEEETVRIAQGKVGIVSENPKLVLGTSKIIKIYFPYLDRALFIPTKFLRIVPTDTEETRKVLLVRPSKPKCLVDQFEKGMWVRLNKDLNIVCKGRNYHLPEGTVGKVQETDYTGGVYLISVHFLNHDIVGDIRAEDLNRITKAEKFFPPDTDGMRQKGRPDKEVEERVIEALRKRRDAGRAKYGTSMERTDLTFAQWLQHLQEELLDAAVYVEKLKAEEQERRELGRRFFAGDI